MTATIQDVHTTPGDYLFYFHIGRRGRYPMRTWALYGPLTREQAIDRFLDDHPWLVKEDIIRWGRIDPNDLPFPCGFLTRRS